MTNEIENETKVIKKPDATGNLASLGLLALGMTTVLLNLLNAGIFATGSMIFAMGIFYGGIAQIIAGIMEWKKNNTFATLTFILFGIFWLSLAGFFLMPVFGFTDASAKQEFVAFLFLWGLFLFAMWIVTFRLTRALQVIFGLFVLLFALMILGTALGNGTILRIAGVEGILCGLFTMFAGFAEVINEVYEEPVIRLW